MINKSFLKFATFSLLASSSVLLCSQEVIEQFDIDDHSEELLDDSSRQGMTLESFLDSCDLSPDKKQEILSDPSAKLVVKRGKGGAFHYLVSYNNGHNLFRKPTTSKPVLVDSSTEDQTHVDASTQTVSELDATPIDAEQLAHDDHASSSSSVELSQELIENALSDFQTCSELHSAHCDQEPVQVVYNVDDLSVTVKLPEEIKSSETESDSEDSDIPVSGTGLYGTADVSTDITELSPDSTNSIGLTVVSPVPVEVDVVVTTQIQTPTQTTSQDTSVAQETQTTQDSLETTDIAPAVVIKKVLLEDLLPSTQRELLVVSTIAALPIVIKLLDKAFRTGFAGTPTTGDLVTLAASVSIGVAGLVSVETKTYIKKMLSLWSIQNISNDSQTCTLVKSSCPAFLRFAADKRFAGTVQLQFYTKEKNLQVYCDQINNGLTEIQGANSVNLASLIG